MELQSWPWLSDGVCTQFAFIQQQGCYSKNLISYFSVFSVFSWNKFQDLTICASSWHVLLLIFISWLLLRSICTCAFGSFKMVFSETQLFLTSGYLHNCFILYISLADSFSVFSYQFKCYFIKKAFSVTTSK